jgi:hypothetical protein
MLPTSPPNDARFSPTQALPKRKLKTYVHGIDYNDVKWGRSRFVGSSEAEQGSGGRSS